MEKNCFLNILDKTFSLLTPGLSKKTQNKWLFRFLILWYPLLWVSDMNKHKWEYWVINSYSDWAFLAPFLIRLPVKKSIVNCSDIIGKGVSLAFIVKTMLKFSFTLKWGWVFPHCITHYVFGSVVVSIPACHAGDLGSIRRPGGSFRFRIKINAWMLFFFF